MFQLFIMNLCMQFKFLFNLRMFWHVNIVWVCIFSGFVMRASISPFPFKNRKDLVCFDWQPHGNSRPAHRCVAPLINKSLLSLWRGPQVKRSNTILSLNYFIFISPTKSINSVRECNCKVIIINWLFKQASTRATCDYCVHNALQLSNQNFLFGSYI